VLGDKEYGYNAAAVYSANTMKIVTRLSKAGLSSSGTHTRRNQRSGNCNANWLVLDIISTVTN